MWSFSRKRHHVFLAILCLSFFYLIFFDPIPNIRAPFKVTKLSPQVKHNVLHTLIHLTKASKYERNLHHRKLLNNVIASLQNTIEQSSNDFQPRSQDDISFVFNCFKECSFYHLEKVLHNISKSSYWSETLVVASSNARKFNIIVANYKKLLPSLKIIDIEESLNFMEVYSKILQHVKTNLIFMTRSITSFSPSVNLHSMIYPILQNKSHVVGSSIVIGGEWKTGCYMMRTLRYETAIMEGYDAIQDSLLLCDYLSGSFVIRKIDLLGYLEQKSLFAKVHSSNDTERILHQPELFFTAELFYMDLFYKFQTKRNIITVVPNIAFEQHQGGASLQNLNRNELKPFVVKNKLSKVKIFGKDFDFNCDEVNIPAIMYGIEGMFLPRCAINELNELLLFSAKTFHKNGFHYELDAGTVVGQAKLSATLPWELDHDIAFRSRHLKPLTKLNETFIKKGFTQKPEFRGLEFCLRNGTWKCGYMGIRSKLWRMELWGQNVLASDLYRKEENVTDRRLVKTHVLGKVTLGQIGNDWVVTQNNPGGYVRSKYGLDVLKHEEHRAEFIGQTSWMSYHGGKWRKCKLSGHHACRDSFLADGNIIFKNIWL